VNGGGVVFEVNIFNGIIIPIIISIIASIIVSKIITFKNKYIDILTRLNYTEVIFSISNIYNPYSPVIRKDGKELKLEYKGQEENHYKYGFYCKKNCKMIVENKHTWKVDEISLDCFIDLADLETIASTSQYPFYFQLKVFISEFKKLITEINKRFDLDRKVLHMDDIKEVEEMYAIEYNKLIDKENIFLYLIPCAFLKFYFNRFLKDPVGYIAWFLLIIIILFTIQIGLIDKFGGVVNITNYLPSISF
jgi:hypothetical protein